MSPHAAVLILFFSILLWAYAITGFIHVHFEVLT